MKHYYVCKQCGEKIINHLGVLWTHIELDHPDIYHAVVRKNNPNIIEKCFEPCNEVKKGVNNDERV